MTHKLIESKHRQEGEFICKYFNSRLLKNNKNVLGAELGSTGSGKSYRTLKAAELWYDNYLKRPFPPENICFSLREVMKRLTSGKLRSGDILIVEEAGANLGSLDFQNKVQKIFTYVLQSFRSMNIGLLFNLPYLSMLNRSARMLLHYSSESRGIDFKENKNKCKLKFHQVNQETGKIYKKYPRAKVEGRIRTIKEFSYSLPSQRLIEVYEQKKSNYLNIMQTDYLDDMDIAEKKREKAKEILAPKELTEIQQRIWDLHLQGLTQKEIVERTGLSQGTISGHMIACKKKGYVANSGVKVTPVLEIGL